MKKFFSAIICGAVALLNCHAAPTVHSTIEHHVGLDLLILKIVVILIALRQNRRRSRNVIHIFHSRALGRHWRRLRRG